MQNQLIISYIFAWEMWKKYYNTNIIFSTLQNRNILLSFKNFTYIINTIYLSNFIRFVCDMRLCSGFQVLLVTNNDLTSFRMNSNTPLQCLKLHFFYILFYFYFDFHGFIFQMQYYLEWIAKYLKFRSQTF